MFDNFYEHIRAAQVEAIKRGINANAVFISDELYFSKLLHQSCGEVPMVCGLKCVYTQELPDDTLFAVVEAEHLPLTKDERIEVLSNENAKLRERLRDICEFIEREVKE